MRSERLLREPPAGECGLLRVAPQFDISQFVLCVWSTRWLPSAAFPSLASPLCKSGLPNRGTNTRSREPLLGAAGEEALSYVVLILGGACELPSCAAS